jgi:hypothetical protein
MPDIPALQYLGLVAICAGVLLFVVTMGQFIVDGAGTPEPSAKPAILITRGVFRWTRNPLYLGMTATLLGEAAYNQSFPLLVYAVFWFAEFGRRVRREEASMLDRYGEAYLHYAESTPAWLPFSRVSPLRSRTKRVPDRSTSAARRRGRPPLEASEMLRKKVLRAGQVLTLFGVAGYINDYIPIFSQSRTPFLWFDPLENLLHLVPGLMLMAAASLPALAAAHRTILAVVGLALVAAAVAGFSLRGQPPPNILGATNFENPIENVIHWLLGVQCLFAATKTYMSAASASRESPCLA